MNDELLNKVKKTELQILCVIDEFCKANGIEYSLYCGTAIGAVRHGGFIPWDDDVDICMTRENFDRFINIWNVNPQDGYYLDFYLDNDEYCNCHAKIRKDKTTFIIDVEEPTVGRHGIWVDIFPFDKLSCDNRRIRRSTAWHGQKTVLLTRASVRVASESIKKKITRAVISLVYRNRIQNELRKSYQRLLANNKKITDNYVWVDMSSLNYYKVFQMPAEMLTTFIDIEFEGHKFPIFKDYHALLTEKYGDYMKLPALEDQVNKHNPVKIMFDE